jgi:hemerythrin
MAFTWTPDLAVGSAFIDAQHQELFAAADALFCACQVGSEQQEVQKLLCFLQDYTAKHFADEEALQQKYHYPDHETHKYLHDAFKRMVQAMADRLAQNGPTEDFVSEIYMVVGQWLIDHVKNQDIKLAAYVHE